MNLSFSSIASIARKGLDIMSKNSPALAAGMAIVTMGGAIAMAIRATKKIEDELMKAHVEKNEAVLDKKIKGESKTDPETEDEKIVELTKTEKAIIYAKVYWPVAALVLLSAACMVTSVCCAQHQIKAMAVVTATAQTALADYEKAAEAVVGKNKATAIKDQVNVTKIRENPPQQDKIFDTGKGKTLCYEPISGRYFYSDIDKIRGAINKLNEDLLDMGFVSLNDYYRSLGLEETLYGDDQGWHYASNGPYGAQIRVSYTSAKVTPDGDATAFVVDVKTEPRFDYAEM